MAEMFLKLEGIDGESLDSAHSGEIEIKSWGWVGTNDIRWDINQGGQSTKVKHENLTIEKVCDKASVTLHQACVTGKHIKNGTITCRKNDGDQKVEYLVIKLKDIMVGRMEWAGEGESQSLKEIVHLAFAEYRMEYKLQNDTGDAGGYKSFQFNIQKQQGS